MGKCLRVSDHMTGSVGFDSSWESKGEERVQQYTHSKHSHVHVPIRGSVTENYCIDILKLLKLLPNCFFIHQTRIFRQRHGNWEVYRLRYGIAQVVDPMCFLQYQEEIRANLERSGEV